MPKWFRTCRVVVLPLFFAVLGWGLVSCATSPKAKGATHGEAAARVAVPANFLTDESRHYQGLQGLELACTVQANAVAGETWVGAVLGQEIRGLSLAARLEALSKAIGLPKALSVGELADLGWMLGELLRRQTGAQYVWHSTRQQVLLSSPAGQLSPLEAIVKLRTGSGTVDEIVKEAKERAKGGGPTEVLACQDVAKRDMLRVRAPLHPPRKRR